MDIEEERMPRDKSYTMETVINSAPLVLDEVYTDEPCLVCPVCGHFCSHIGRVYTRLGSDQYEAAVYAGTQVGETTDQRRSGLVVTIDGECGHNWRIIIQQHKGINSILTEWATRRRRTCAV
jgi:hypothetical protein